MASGFIIVAISQLQYSNLKQNINFEERQRLDLLGQRLDRSVQSSAIMRLASFSGLEAPVEGKVFTHLSGGNERLYRCWKHNSDTLGETIRPTFDCVHKVISSFVMFAGDNKRILPLAGSRENTRVYYSSYGDVCSEGLEGAENICPVDEDKRVELYPYQAIAEFRAICPGNLDEGDVCAIANIIQTKIQIIGPNNKRVYPRGKQVLSEDNLEKQWFTLTTSHIKGQQCNEGAVAVSSINGHLKCQCVFPWQKSQRRNVNGDVCFRSKTTSHYCKPHETPIDFDPQTGQLRCLETKSIRNLKANFNSARRGKTLNTTTCQKRGWITSIKPKCGMTCKSVLARGRKPNWRSEIVSAGAGIVGGAVLLLSGGSVWGSFLGALGITSVFYAVKGLVVSEDCPQGLPSCGEPFFLPCDPIVECSLEVECEDYDYK
ncbi:MAG: hypothetical protein AB8C84_08650 [Oligoflexales bacterium]